MSIDSEYQNRILLNMKEASFESRLYAATFAAGAEEGSGIVAKALLELLEERKWLQSQRNETHFGIMLGRALVGLATATLNIASQKTRHELITLAITHVDEHIEDVDCQLRAHAAFARKLLRGEEPTQMCSQ
ncbi:MAG: hypothetical protein SFV81_04995 [Pirellulaceae bacterium]|nr:hypothetical protein [Pirellulaceae bacterium]